MKTSIAITLIAVGGLLMVAPVLALQWQVQRAATYYEQHGSGSALPEQMRPQPHSRYDWASLAVGAVLALVGVASSLRPRASTGSAMQESCSSDSPSHHFAAKH